MLTAQTRIKGSISSDGISFVNVPVTLDKTTKTKTDSLGYFRFENVALGSHELNIVFEEILNELVENLDTFIKVSDFYNANYQIESTIKNQVTKTINYLLDYILRFDCFYFI